MQTKFVPVENRNGINLALDVPVFFVSATWINPPRLRAPPVGMGIKFSNTSQAEENLEISNRASVSSEISPELNEGLESLAGIY